MFEASTIISTLIIVITVGIGFVAYFDVLRDVYCDHRLRAIQKILRRNTKVSTGDVAKGGSSIIGGLYTYKTPGPYGTGGGSGSGVGGGASGDGRDPNLLAKVNELLKRIKKLEEQSKQP